MVPAFRRFICCNNVKTNIFFWSLRYLRNAYSNISGEVAVIAFKRVKFRFFTTVVLDQTEPVDWFFAYWTWAVSYYEMATTLDGESLTKIAEKSVDNCWKLVFYQNFKNQVYGFIHAWWNSCEHTLILLSGYGFLQMQQMNMSLNSGTRTTNFRLMISIFQCF